MRMFSATAAAKPVVTEHGDRAIDTLFAAALAVTVTDAGESAAKNAAISAVETEFGAYTGVKVFVDDTATPTRANVIAALEAVIAQLKTSNVYS
jgi:hypothetical protein